MYGQIYLDKLQTLQAGATVPVFSIMCTLLFFRMIHKNITKYDLKHTNNDDLAFYHVAFQPKYPDYTYVRKCVTIRPPSTTELGDEHRVSCRVFFENNREESL